MATQVLCKVDGCGKPKHAHGYCARHAYHFKAHGDPLGGRRSASPGEPLQWILEHASYDGDDCLRWPFEVGRYGYGVVKHNGIRRVASRVMCEAVHGEAPVPGMEAAHSCGNGHMACMTPRHLRWATKVENVQDAVAHGTNVRGERVHWAKLTELEVREIKRIGASMLQEDIAHMFGVQSSTISRILAGKRWAWVV